MSAVSPLARLDGVLHHLGLARPQPPAGVASAAERGEILAGLMQPQAALSPKYFYDQRGSELFEAITLVQTKKVTSFPIVLVGTDYWGGLLDWLRSSALEHGTISPADLDLVTITDDVDVAVRTIVRADRGPQREEPTTHAGPEVGELR